MSYSHASRRLDRLGSTKLVFQVQHSLPNLVDSCVCVCVVAHRGEGVFIYDDFCEELCIYLYVLCVCLFVYRLGHFVWEDQ